MPTSGGDAWLLARALARESRGRHVRGALAAFALTVVASSPAIADPVRGEATLTKPGDYARLLIKLQADVQAMEIRAAHVEILFQHSAAAAESAAQARAAQSAAQSRSASQGTGAAQGPSSTQGSAQSSADPAGAKPARNPASSRRTSARQSCPSSRSIDADATAAASGLAMNVGP